MSSIVVPQSPTTIKGSCNCGAITLSIPSDAFPSYSTICHCTNCRATGGSLFSVNLTIPMDKIKISGQPKVYRDKGDSGGFVRRNFCGDCGSPIFAAREGAPGEPRVKGGLFRASGFDIPPPELQKFWRNHEEWETPIEGVALQE